MFPLPAKFVYKKAYVHTGVQKLPSSKNGKFTMGNSGQGREKRERSMNYNPIAAKLCRMIVVDFILYLVKFQAERALGR